MYFSENLSILFPIIPIVNAVREISWNILLEGDQLVTITSLIHPEKPKMSSTYSKVSKGHCDNSGVYPN